MKLGRTQWLLLAALAVLVWLYVRSRRPTLVLSSKAPITKAPINLTPQQIQDQYDAGLQYQDLGHGKLIIPLNATRAVPNPTNLPYDPNQSAIVI